MAHVPSTALVVAMPPGTRGRSSAAARHSTTQALVAQIVEAVKEAADARDAADANVQRLWRTLSDAYGEDLAANSHRSKPFREFIMEEIPEEVLRSVLEFSFQTSFRTNAEARLLQQVSQTFDLNTWAIIYVAFGTTVSASRRSLRALHKLKKARPELTFDEVADAAEASRKRRLGTKYRPGFQPPMQLNDILTAVESFDGPQNPEQEETGADQETEDDHGTESDQETKADREKKEEEAGQDESEQEEQGRGLLRNPSADQQTPKAAGIDAETPSRLIASPASNSTPACVSNYSINDGSSLLQVFQLEDEHNAGNNSVEPETGQGAHAVPQSPEGQEELVPDDYSCKRLSFSSLPKISRILPRERSLGVSFGNNMFEVSDDLRSPSPAPKTPFIKSDKPPIDEDDNRHTSWLQSVSSGFKLPWKSPDVKSASSSGATANAHLGKRDLKEELEGNKPKRPKLHDFHDGSTDPGQDTPPSINKPPSVDHIIDLSPLRAGQWLNDNIVNMATELATAASPSSFLFIESWLFSSNAQKSRATEMKLQESPEADILTPINVQNTHWTLMHIHRATKTAIIYDSLGQGLSTEEKAQQCLCQLHRLFPSHFPEDMVLEWGKCARQPNSSDCGIATIINSISIASGLSPALRIPWNVYRPLIGFLLGVHDDETVATELIKKTKLQPLETELTSIPWRAATPPAETSPTSLADAVMLQRKMSEALERAESRRLEALDGLINDRSVEVDMLKEIFNSCEILKDKATCTANKAKADIDATLNEFTSLVDNAYQWVMDPAQSEWAVGSGSRMDELTQQRRRAEKRSSLAGLARRGFERVKDELATLIDAYQKSLDELNQEKSRWGVIVSPQGLATGRCTA
ncbi:uncharacterized protein LY79DRAFT_663814 [Colletotrichum navitas]|uniref:Ubiquitin-like protease family profile domain-containing protein n=1 Tax=Colletotrichum navitas TaxID=681940 RepID=A0AAD8PK44_9PEZI|nr:uncharacterized protein LY79DRAFT_663814 [Colletotrichum navitas]KAK1566257.1 hypothetical protein LY79DRAFT_663814 [Colletotrichum navitas]